MATNKYPMLIGGQPVSAEKTIDVVDPTIGWVVGQAPEAQGHHMQAALHVAQRGFELWSAVKPAERKRIILNYADLLAKDSERLIALLIAETGKLQDNAEYDFGMLTTCLRFFVEEFERLDQPVLHDPDGRFLHYTLRQPLGVAVGMLAWNFPLLNVGYKLGPVLASGCSAILKPSHLTPLASLEAVHLAKEAGLPDGVINMVTSTDHSVTEALLASEIPSLVTMIGSTRGGLEVMNSSCTSVKRFSVELGGNAPVVVYPDADVVDAANKTIDLKFANCGQVCVSPNRCFVHDSIHDEFVKAAKERTSSVVMGPMMTDKARHQVLSLVDAAVAEGAEIVCGGNIVDGKGFYFEPTVLKNVDPGMRIASDEIFGPVLPILRFSDDDDEIALANDTPFGLAAYVFTTNLSRGLRAARDIDAGSVCVNEPHYSVQLPHGGVKQSGVGKDCSRYSIEEYLTLKRVSVLIED